MRRSLTIMVVGLALLAMTAPAQATTRVPFVGPARSYELVGVCPPFTIFAQERAGHPGFLTLDDNGVVVKVEFQGSYDTVLSGPHELTFGTIGSTVVTANGDGTWTMVQKGSGLAVVPSGDPEGPKLVWFTGRVTSVGKFDSKTLTFVPSSQVRSGISSNVCDMLVTGLKARHDAR